MIADSHVIVLPTLLAATTLNTDKASSQQLFVDLAIFQQPVEASKSPKVTAMQYPSEV